MLTGRPKIWLQKTWFASKQIKKAMTTVNELANKIKTLPNRKLPKRREKFQFPQIRMNPKDILITGLSALAWFKSYHREYF